MKITMLTLGSRGDVQPYVALGQGLIKNGHEVTICTGESFKEFVEKSGINFFKATADFMSILSTDEGKTLFEGGGKNIFKTMRYAKEVINPLFRSTFDDFYKASMDSDVIIYHPKAMVACDIAEHIGAKSICISPVPIIYPITEFPNLGAFPTQNFGGFLNKLTYLPVKFSDSAFMKEINDFRITTLGAKTRNGGKYSDVNKMNILYPISKSIFKDVKSWDDHVLLSGFLFMDSSNEQIEDNVIEFLDKGEQPWVISFSSMPLKNPERFRDTILETMSIRNERAIVITGNSGMNFDDHDNILSIKAIPHRFIFGKAKGIIHHGGIGTTAEALLSGAPQHIIPFNVDQPFWANRLVKLGLMSGIYKEDNINASVLDIILTNMMRGETIEKSLQMKKLIETEDGIIEAVKYIEGVCDAN